MGVSVLKGGKRSKVDQGEFIVPYLIALDFEHMHMYMYISLKTYPNYVSII